MAKKKCEVCGKEQDENKSFVHRFKKDGKIFCSLDCIEKFYEDQEKCDKCSKKMEVMGNHYYNPNKDDGKFFCSQECYKEYYKTPTKNLLIGLGIIILITVVAFITYRVWNKKKKKY